MSLRIPDFRCANGHVFEEMIDTGSWNGEMTCACGAPAQKLIGAPAVHGEENVPKERMRAAQQANIHGAPDQPVPPFIGTTRSELKTWERTFNVVDHSGGERRSGRLSLQQKVPWLKTPEGERKKEEIFARSREIAKAGGEAVQREIERMESPNAFDVSAFAQQANAGIVSVNQDMSLTGDIASELAGAVNR